MSKKIRIVYIDMKKDGTITVSYSNTPLDKCYTELYSNTLAFHRYKASAHSDTRVELSRDYLAERESKPMHRIISFLEQASQNIKLYRKSYNNLYNEVNPYASWLRFQAAWNENTAVRGSWAIVAEEGK